jgi:hypothetical protein
MERSFAGENMTEPLLARTLFVKRLWTQYKQDPNDAAKFIPVDWVEYGQIGNLERSTTCSRISTLRDCLIPMADNADPAVAMAHARWNAIKPHYEAWKAGEEMPEVGTPLAAWNAVTHEQASVLKSNGVRTVEDVASLTDTHLDRIRIPRLRDLITQAQQFLEASDANRVANSIAKRDEQINAQQAEIVEQRETIAELMRKVDALASMVVDTESDDEPAAKRGPGRPRKEQPANIGA